MIGSLVTYAFTVSVLLAFAALGAEQLVGRLAWPKRVVWISSLVISLVLPLSIALMTQPVAASIDSSPISAYQSGEPRDILRGGSDRVALNPQHEHPIEALKLPDVTIRSVRSRFPAPAKVLGLAWLCLSIGTVLFYLLLWLQLCRLANRCPRVELDGVLVRQTEKLGPAVFGFLRPEILIPKWLLASAPEMRSIALRHEREHIAARDPLLLLSGMLLVALAPWNPSLWWQLGRLRFAIEADCDARALREGINVEAYTEALLTVGARGSLASSHLMALTTRTSWLERRVRLMVSGAGRISRFAAGSGAALAVGLIIAALCLQAPGLAAPSGLRKLPPQDTRPAATAAIAVAQSEFPELFNQEFEGTAVVAVLFNRDGSVQLARKHLFPPDQPPSDLRMDLENEPLGIDPQDDILDGGHEAPDYTIGPWLQSKNPGRLFIVYEVLKWQHDPTRTRERVRKSLEAYDPGLLKVSGVQQSGEVIQLTVFMNEDGTVNREEKLVYRVGENAPGDWEERFAAMGIRREWVGRRGSLAVTEPTAAAMNIEYAWPRRADDPADVADFEAAWRESYSAHLPKQDDRNDGEIIARYFLAIKERGRQAVTETRDGLQSLLTPWILLGRDGQIWGTGLRHNELEKFSFGMNTLREIEARYPGIRVDFGTGGACLPMKGVPVTCVWISPDSPIQRKQDVDLRKRKDILLTTTFIYETPSDPSLRDLFPISLQFSDAMDLDDPVNVGPVPNLPWVKVTASPSGTNAVALLVRTREFLVSASDPPIPKDWTPVDTLQVSYGSAAELDLFDISVGAPRKVRLILRPQQIGMTQ